MSGYPYPPAPAAALVPVTLALHAIDFKREGLALRRAHRYVDRAGRSP